MPEKVIVKPNLIRWAIDRSRLPVHALTVKFPKLDAWKSGKLQPTIGQLELFAKATFTPLGYLFLDSPPDETLPIPDFRTVGDSPIGRPSPDLIETIQAMQRRQAWMHEFLIEESQEPLSFVGSATGRRDIAGLSTSIRRKLGLESGWARTLSTWEAAVRTLRDAADRVGILVGSSGIVGLNTRRALKPQEFRGFVLCDEYAPLIFVNSNDSKSAQMFTLAHELAHLWIGEGGLFNLIRTLPNNQENEQFCNRVAAEFLVPADEFSEYWTAAKDNIQPFHWIARQFKVSPVVAARRALDLRFITRAMFVAFYEQDQADWNAQKARRKAGGASGGNFYASQSSRLGKRFSLAVVRAAREGRLLYREAYQLTDLRGETFAKYAELLRQEAAHGGR